MHIGKEAIEKEPREGNAYVRKKFLPICFSFLGVSFSKDRSVPSYLHNARHEIAADPRRCCNGYEISSSEILQCMESIFVWLFFHKQINLCHVCIRVPDHSKVHPKSGCNVKLKSLSVFSSSLCIIMLGIEVNPTFLLLKEG